jgi:hypothetical protein
MHRFTGSVAAVIALASPLAAQNNGSVDALELTRIAGSIEVDGRPDDAAWQSVPTLPLTMYIPVFRGQPTRRTEIRIAYDESSLYAGGWFYDDPAGIRVNSLYRDRWNGDDAFAIYIDAFNDNETSKWFGITPAGMRFDQLISEDGDVLNASWDGFWEARTTVTSEGWFVEVRIPFSTLGFQVGAGEDVTMGLTVTRLVSRTGERVTFPAIDPRFEFRRPSQAHDVVLRNVRSERPVYVTPYALAGLDQRAVLNDTRTRYLSNRDPQREAGLDLRYAFTPSLTLDVTANTDFAQVEADDQQVNLDRFNLFFPEKRRFFQERSDLFTFTTGGEGQLFHSRNIGLAPDRTPVPVLGGARLVGRVGSWDVGLLGMATDGSGVLPSERFGVARLRRRVFNPLSTAGLIATTRFDEDQYNFALGADGSFHVTGDHYLSLKWAGTVDDAEPDSVSLSDRSVFDARWERRTQRGLGYSFNLTRSGSDYDPGIGFLQRRDFTRGTLAGNWYLFTDNHPILRRIYPGALAFATYRNSDGSLESGTYAVWVQWDTKSGGGGWIEPKLFVEDVAEAFTIGDEVDIPAGRHQYADLQLVLRMNPGARLRTDLDARAGSYFDGTRAQVILAPTWNASRHLELGVDYQLSMLRFPDRNQKANVQVGRLRIRTALNARASGNAFVQYNSITDRVETNLRLRYNFSEGTDLWIVYNEGLATERLPDPDAPRLPLSMSRAFILKFSRTFAF